MEIPWRQRRWLSHSCPCSSLPLWAGERPCEGTPQATFGDRIIFLRGSVNCEQEGSKLLSGDLDLLRPFLLRAHDHHRAVGVVNDGGGDASHQRPPAAAETPAPHHYEPGAQLLS